MSISKTVYIPLSTIDFEDFKLDLTEVQKMLMDGYTVSYFDQYLTTTTGEKGLVIQFVKKEDNAIPYSPIYRG